MYFNLGIWCVILGQCNFFSKVKLSLNRFNGLTVPFRPRHVIAG